MQKLSFQQQVLGGFILTLICIFSGALIAHHRIQELQNDSKSVDRTQEIIKFTNQVFINVVQAESSVRGLTSTGNSYYLDAYNENLSKITPSVDRLGSLLRDDPDQAALADSLKFYVSQKLYVMSKILWTINSNNFTSAKAELLTDRSINHVQSLIEAIKAKEGIYLADKRKISEANVAETLQLFLAGSIVILGLFLLLFQYIRISFRKRKAIEDNLTKTNEQLQLMSEENKMQNWLLKGCTVIDEAMRGQRQIKLLSKAIIDSVCLYTDANVGAIYIPTERNTLKIEAGYAFDSDLYKIEIMQGDGLVGRVCADKMPYLLNNVPTDYIKIKSALGEASPGTILIQPLLFEGKIKGVIELGFLEMPENTAQFVDRVSHNIAVAINGAEAMYKVQALLEHAAIFSEEVAMN